MRLQKFKLGKTSESFESIIGKTLKIEGNIFASDSIRIDGVISGDIFQEKNCEVTIAIAHGAVVTGKVIAENVIISGEVRGNIVSTKRIEVLSTAIVFGDIAYASIGLEVGARIHGNLNQQDENSGQLKPIEI